MNIKNLFQDEDAVSPVIGVILMVAITVILAAVIASFVLGLGDQQETAPQVSFDVEYDEGGAGSGADKIVVTKSGGDDIAGANIYVRGNNPDPVAWDATDYSASSSVDDYSSSSSMNYNGGYSSGDSLDAGQGFEIVYGGSAGSASVYEITLVYEDGDTSEELVTDEGPDA